MVFQLRQHVFMPLFMLVHYVFLECYTWVAVSHAKAVPEEIMSLL